MEYRPPSFLSTGSGSGRAFTPSPPPTEPSTHMFPATHVPARKPLPQHAQHHFPFNQSTAAPLLNAEDRWPTTPSLDTGGYPRQDSTFKPEAQISVTERTGWQRPLRKSPRVPVWWWWEIASAALSLACMVLLLILLLKVSETPLERWSLPIQPSSVIAILTTVGKAAMMVPIAGCVSQLKWLHFEKREDELRSLQVFDDASRGPWGAAMLLLKIPTRALLAGVFALVTIIALGYDPSAQQILEFPLRLSPLQNATTAIGRADNYYSKAYVEGAITNTQVPNPDLLKLQSAILNGASGAVPPPFFECPEPARTCSWPQFTTLGICSTFEDLTGVATHSCEGDTLSELNCTYDFPGRIDTEDQITMSYNKIGTTNSPASDLFQSKAYLSLDVDGYSTRLTAVKVTDKAMGDTTPPLTQLLHVTWFFCTQTFKEARGVPRGLLTSDRPSTERVTHAGTTSVADDFNPLNANYATYVANSTGQQYKITRLAETFIFGYLSRLLERKAVDSQLALRSDEDLDLGLFLYTSDLDTVTADIATTLSNQIRSRDPGDNANATFIQGEAEFEETFIRVRWPWMILPMAETVVTAVLLALTILITRSQPVLKESVLAYLAYGTDVSVREGLLAPAPQTGEEMEGAAKGVRVRLLKGDDGRMTLVGH